uniref:DUF4347 domain-containing protein n=1 Tax=uncultured marine group II/III euryarchaeote KM3_195_B08 TaxID=1457970 RepID=A0A075GUX7_9EURY|nr:hypothetical protein [uncultured marine group II/III euryarchaeote KM3_195_B08]
MRIITKIKFKDKKKAEQIQTKDTSGKRKIPITIERQPKTPQEIEIERLGKRLGPEYEEIFLEIQTIINNKTRIQGIVVKKRSLKEKLNGMFLTFLKQHPKQLKVYREFLEVMSKPQNTRTLIEIFACAERRTAKDSGSKNVRLELMKLFLEVNNDPELKELTIEEKINITYGRSLLGTKNAEKLRKTRGIVYFIRYSAKEIERQIYQVDRTYKPKHVSIEELRKQQARPTLLAVYGKDDHNGAFYLYQGNFDHLSKSFKIVLYETDNERGVYNAVRETHKKHGQITHFMIGGHGTPDSIALGRIKPGDSKEERERKILDLTDTKELAKLKVHLKGATLLLESCSTGRKQEDRENMREMLMRSLDVVEVFAPKEMSAAGKTIHSVEIINGKPRVVNADYELMSEIIMRYAENKNKSIIDAFEGDSEKKNKLKKELG